MQKHGIPQWRVEVQKGRLEGRQPPQGDRLATHRDRHLLHSRRADEEPNKGQAVFTDGMDRGLRGRPDISGVPCLLKLLPRMTSLRPCHLGMMCEIDLVAKVQDSAFNRLWPVVVARLELGNDYSKKWMMYAENLCQRYMTKLHIVSEHVLL